MTRRRPRIPQKRPVFFGCEGDSEAAYGQVINDQLRAADLPVFMNVNALTPGAGDPLSRIQLALKCLSQLEKQRGKYWKKAIILDADQAANNAQRASDARRLAVQNQIQLIWQDPCHEAVLLRHLQGFEANRPPTCPAAEAALRQQWPDYEKPMSRLKLAQRIDLEAIRRAAAVEQELGLFLTEIGLLRQ